MYGKVARPIVVAYSRQFIADDIIGNQLFLCVYKKSRALFMGLFDADFTARPKGIMAKFAVIGR